jgi:CBS domain-containing protein
MGRRPPLGLFRDFAVETHGEHAGTLDLKCGAAAVFVDAARVYALAAGEGSPATDERLRRGATAAGVDRREVEGWVDAFHFIQVLRLRTQLEHDRSGLAPSNRLDPYALNPLERRFFRESLRQAVVVQKRMEAAFASEAPRI